MKRIPWNTIGQRVMRLPGVLAEHAFLFTLLFIAIAGVFSLVIFAYGFSVQTKHLEQEVSPYKVKEDLFLDVQLALQEREKNLQNATTQVSRDIFNPD